MKVYRHNRHHTVRSKSGRTISIYLDDEIWKYLSKIAKAEGKSLQDIVTTAIESRTCNLHSMSEAVRRYAFRHILRELEILSEELAAERASHMRRAA